MTHRLYCQVRNGQVFMAEMFACWLSLLKEADREHWAVVARR